MADRRLQFLAQRQIGSDGGGEGAAGAMGVGIGQARVAEVTELVADGENVGAVLAFEVSTLG